MTHDGLQKNITDLATWLGIFWWHDNDSLRNKAGLPDLYLVGNHPRPDGRPADMWREVKVPPDDLKPKQREFGERALAAGVDWAVWTPADWPARVRRELEAIRCPAQDRTQVPVTVISFGYGHCRAHWGRRPAGVPEAHATYDLRHHFRDPHVTPGLRDLTGVHATIESIVLGTPGIRGLVEAIVATVGGFRGGPQAGEVIIAIGCAGGWHRSVAVAAEVARRLDADDIPVTLRHRDIGRPVIRPGRPPAVPGHAARAASLRACGLQPRDFGIEPIPPQIRLWRAITRWHATS